MISECVDRSHFLQQTVLAYFRSYPEDATIVPRPNLPCMVDVELRGQLAAKFETVSDPLDGDPSRRQLRLLFDRAYAPIAHSYELISPGSPILRLMLNDLAETGAFTRSGVMFNIDRNYGDLQQLGIQIHHARIHARTGFLLRRYYLLRYMVRLTSYEKTEDIVPVLIEADSLQAQDASVAALVAAANLGDLAGTQYFQKVPSPNGDEVGKVIEAADQVVQQRIKSSLQERCSDLAKKKAEDVQRIEGHFAVEIKRAQETQRDELEREKEQNIREIENRYTMQTEATLLSVQEIIAPCVEYRLKAENGGQSREIPQRFLFDPLEYLENCVQTDCCESCGQVRVWAYCANGNHLDCGHCGQTEECYAPDCEATACAEHAVRCSRSDCMHVCCDQHVMACSYCSSAEVYCAEHIPTSFEQLPICLNCATQCMRCRENFPPDRTADCAVCKARFCDAHLKNCPGCKEQYCEDHGQQAHGRAKEYCLNCLDNCVRCDGSVLHLRSDLQYCTDCGKSLCPTHVIKCVACDAVICEDHALDTPDGGKGCGQCYAPCSTCQSITPRRQLSKCPHCDPAVAEDHCSNHACVGCSKPVCDSHALDTTEGRGCIGCFAPCSTCGTIARRGQLSKCPHCDPAVATDHCSSHACVACSKPVCDVHARDTAEGRGCIGCFASCSSCAAVHRRKELRTCHICGDGDQAIHCVKHARTCAICGEQTCDRHRVTLHDGASACEKCSRACSRCHEFFDARSLLSCTNCGQEFCSDHVVTSQFVADHYCEAHAQQLFTSCPGCGRRGPSSELRQCDMCGVSYGPHCQPAAQTRCTYCQDLQPIPEIMQQELQEIAEAVSRPGCEGVSTGRIAKEMTEMLSDTVYRLTGTTTDSHTIIHGVYRGGVFGFLKRPFRRVKEFVLLRDRAGSDVRVRVIR